MRLLYMRKIDADPSPWAWMRGLEREGLPPVLIELQGKDRSIVGENDARHALDYLTRRMGASRLPVDVVDVENRPVLL
jgi:hypothetical protein